ncbi:unnamed protein product [Didymodactylos carnosus]|uniref:Proteasome assembly chaperone 1 n=1 Tax=Didymodactylos carnosus TaxID=1234261 RepID=A0A8S2CQB4_9BILA|nr:unnamed protein product [Didymodactylos carnosus]CAF3492775.1 unnamed protein product [Didymodactylos carnosus]
MSFMYGLGDIVDEETFGDQQLIDSDQEDERRSSRDPDKLPFSIIWRDDIKSENVKIPCKNLLITIGATASAFAYTHLLCNFELELIGHATDAKEKPFDQVKTQQYATQQLDRIYKLNGSSGSLTPLVVIQINSNMKSDRLYPISDQIREKFTTESVYVIESLSTMDYVTTDGKLENESNMFIRYIKTSSQTEHLRIKPIEPPNTIRGISAALFTRFHQNNIPIVVFILYQRHSSVNSDALKLIQRVLDKTNISQYIQPTDKTNKQLLRLLSASSNMYS